jgi:hypothetical protein
MPVHRRHGRETGLSQFLDGLGPEGISEVSLYRVLPTKKQEFVTSGSPSQFSEQYVQVTYGGGDYMVRSKLNGRWFRSKSFSVEAPLEVTIRLNGSHGSRDSELERLRIEIEAQAARMEADRRTREQRNHELILKLIESHGNASGPSRVDLASAVKTVKGHANSLRSDDDGLLD